MTTVMSRAGVSGERRRMAANKQQRSDEYDVIIVGAGVIGSAAAHVLATQGERCLLLEAAPEAIRRYAGEWMHPTVRVLMERLGIPLPKAAMANDAGAGFIVHPEDGSPPIALPYPEGQRGFCCSHFELASSVRKHAAAHPNVDYVPFARVIDVQRDGRVRFHAARELADREVRARLVVGAEGRSSVCRRVLEPDSNRDVVSYMAALSLDGDVTLPREGYGHLFMGAPGIALAYRVSRREVRLCLDVPVAAGELRRDRDRLFAAFAHVLPDHLREQARAAVHGAELRWTATFFQPRAQRGEDRIVLVGDAVGLCHPLCSAGVAIGLLDVALLGDAVAKHDLHWYRRRGARETWVPELMSCAVYHLLGQPDVSDPLRQTVYRSWREDHAARDQTMNILTGMERRPAMFASTFAKLGFDAVTAGIKSQSARRPLDAVELLQSFERWLRWPVAGLMPQWMVARVRPRATIHAPF